MDSKRIDIGVGVVLCILSIVFYWYAEQYDGRVQSAYGPHFFPQVLSLLLLISSVLLIVQALKGRALKNLEKINKSGFIQVFITIVLAIAYLVGMQYIGFLPATILFLYLVMFSLGQKKLWVRITSSVLVSSAVYGIFRFFLKIPLPEGIF